MSATSHHSVDSNNTNTPFREAAHQQEEEVEADVTATTTGQNARHVRKLDILHQDAPTNLMQTM